MRYILQYSKAFSGFSVNDIEKAKKFYSEKLGISITEQGNMGFSLDIAGGNILSILSD